MPTIHGTEQTYQPFTDATSGAAIEAYRFSKYDTDGETIIQCSVAGEAATAGVSRYKVTAAGDQVALARYPSIAYVEFGGVVSPLGEVSTSNVGKAVAAGTAGHKRLGRYLGTVNTADGVVGPVLLYPEIPAEDVVPAAAIADSGITATNPDAPTAYAAVVNMTNPVTKAEGEAVSAALATLRSEVAAYELVISALVVDVTTLSTKLNLALAALRASGVIAP